MSVVDVLADANRVLRSLLEEPNADARDLQWESAKGLVEMGLRIARGRVEGDVSPGHSVRVPDALGERDVASGPSGGVLPATPSAIRKDAGPSRSPSARERVGWRLVDGGHA